MNNELIECRHSQVEMVEEEVRLLMRRRDAIDASVARFGATRPWRPKRKHGYAPDLDDGVAINAAPLHRLNAWKEPEAVWQKLKKGEYDRAKLAIKYWPERVLKKARNRPQARHLPRSRGFMRGVTLRWIAYA